MPFRYHIHHHLRSATKRGILSIVLVVGVTLTGTLGIHRLEGLSWVESFYFMSMIATAQGPAFEPQTSAGMIFTSAMAFVSVGTVVAALGFLFGPFFGRLWRIGVEKLEEEIESVTRHKRPSK